MGNFSGTWELLLCEYWRKSMIIGEKNTDLKRLKLRFMTEIGRLHWNQGEEVAHFAWFGEPWSLSTHISNFDDIGQCWIFAVLWWPFWKWRPVEIFQCRESIRDIIIYPHIKFWWYRTMLNLCGIVVAILKMGTGKKFSMSGINSGHYSGLITHSKNRATWLLSLLT